MLLDRFLVSFSELYLSGPKYLHLGVYSFHFLALYNTLRITLTTQDFQFINLSSKWIR